MATNDEQFEVDSEVGEEVDIDDTGNIQSADVLFNSNSIAHILAGYGTDICEQLITEFV